MNILKLVPQDFVDYSAPPLWGCTNKASLFTLFNPKNVHAALHPFLLSVSSDDATLAELIELNTNMEALWICAHEDANYFPSILKTKRTDLKKATKKHLRGTAASELLQQLWSDHPALLASLKDSLLGAYPVVDGVDTNQPFEVLFRFSLPPSLQPDLSVIGNSPVTRSSRSQQPAKRNKGLSSNSKVPATDTPALKSHTPTAIISKCDTPAFQLNPVVPVDVAQLIKEAHRVILKPSPLKQTFLLETKLCPCFKKSKGSFESTMEKLVLQLVNKEYEGFMLARLFFDFERDGEASEDESATNINYQKVFVQPGIVTLPYPIEKGTFNCLKCVWFACISSDGDVSIPCETQYQFLSENKPFIIFNTWDAFNPNPSHMFSKQQFGNGCTYFANVDDFIAAPAQTLKSSPNPSRSLKRRKPEAASTNSIQASTPAASQSSCKRSNISNMKSTLLAIVDDVVEAQDGMPMSVHFLDAQGNWPLCRSKKCKELGKYAVYGEQAKKKPVYCYSCKDSNMLHTHFNNLKVWLKSKGMLDKYKVDKNDTSMCAAFGLATKAQHSDAASEN